MREAQTSIISLVFELQILWQASLLLPWPAYSRCSRYSGSYSHPLARGGLSERNTMRNFASFLISSVMASMGSPAPVGYALTDSKRYSPGACPWGTSPLRMTSTLPPSGGEVTSAGTVIRSPGASWCTRVYSTLLMGNSVSRLVLTLILCPCTYSRIVFPLVVLLVAVLTPANSNRLASSPVGIPRKRNVVGLFVWGLRLRSLLGHPSHPAATRQARRSGRLGAAPAGCRRSCPSSRRPLATS